MARRDERTAARARSFGAVADAYDRGRPGYPAALVPWLLPTLVPGEAGPAPDVIDVGAGTGKLTRVLAAAGARVTAVEPDPAMAQALRARGAAVAVHVAPAEQLPLPDSSADAVVAAQAYHWFDPPRFFAETARVLRPGGRVALVWNRRDDRVAWVAQLNEVLGDEGFDTVDPARDLNASGRFGPVEEASFEHVQPLDAERLRDLAASRSYVSLLPEPERERVLAAVAAVHAGVADADGIVRLPYVLRAFAADLR
ncbi:class I SAM-dependent methyltransferase [Motilibacter aurantiacus]|uniref:class I SAM-dependent methyltransferase n=1 Tax=Motilibacter aurantiacus TaxID=2714955 RepID=UPI001407ECD5|nr:class I SAM-dependent methyltransferase [Motilibacter aurantiacus]NHC44359.1 class I SAM-dependent methyltransferase [Motilibacter aurantiacus]